MKRTVPRAKVKAVLKYHKPRLRVHSKADILVSSRLSSHENWSKSYTKSVISILNDL